jgi:hypothetical protein
MDLKINHIQLVGILLLIVGLILNSLIFLFSYYKLVAHVKQKSEEKKGKLKKNFPVIRFVFRFRKVLKDIQDEEKKESYELVVTFLKWVLLLAIILTLVGLLLFSIGFFF